MPQGLPSEAPAARPAFRPLNRRPDRPHHLCGPRFSRGDDKELRAFIVGGGKGRWGPKSSVRQVMPPSASGILGDPDPGPGQLLGDPNSCGPNRARADSRREPNWVGLDGDGMFQKLHIAATTSLATLDWLRLPATSTVTLG